MEKIRKNEISKLVDLPNIGHELERQLIQVGITKIEDLKKIGAKQTWIQIQQIDSSACIHRLLAIEGAIRGVRKCQLPLDVKNELKEFYHWNRI